MLLDALPLFLLALILGFKHAFDTDHIIAVATYIPKSKSTQETLKMSMSWAAGHMATAAIITLVIFVYRDFLLFRFLEYFETVVGGMLIFLGLAGIISALGIRLFHIHEHKDEDPGHLHVHSHGEGEIHTHYHKHMFGIGIIHGLASNDELIVLFTASLGVATLIGLISYVAIFTIGVVIGMMVFGYLLSYPLLRADKEEITKKALMFFSLISIVYGLFVIKEGLLL